MATFLEILEAAAASCPETEIKEIPAPAPTCKMCRWAEDVNENGLCADCQQAVDRGYQISQLAGRCANGAERDHGVRYHARMLNGLSASWTAVCGYSPGRRSAGWSTWHPAGREVTCPKCARRLSNKSFVPTAESSR